MIKEQGKKFGIFGKKLGGKKPSLKGKDMDIRAAQPYEFPRALEEKPKGGFFRIFKRSWGKSNEEKSEEPSKSSPPETSDKYKKLKKPKKQGSSVVGKSWSSLKEQFKSIGRGIKKGWNITKKIVTAPFRAVGAVAKVGFSVAKTGFRAIKGFAKLSHKVGKAVAVGTYKAAKWYVTAVIDEITGLIPAKGAGAAKGGAVKPGAAPAKPGFNDIAKQIGFKPSGIIPQVVNFAPGQIIVKMGWRALKWGVKKLWKGLKKLVFKAIQFFKSLFKMGGKFVNKVSWWAARIGEGITNKMHRFIVKPISNILVCVVGFFSGLIMSPITFMKWLIPSVFQKIREVLSNIGQGIKGVVKATWGIIKKILFNPFTLALLIGGIFFFFGPKIMEWLSDKVGSLKENLIPTLKSVALSIWEFLKGVWKVLSTVGTWLFKWIEKTTAPEGPVARFISKLVAVVTKVTKLIWKLCKAFGYSSVDILCMVIAGDWYGLMFAMIGGMCVKFWNWVKRIPPFSTFIAIIKAVLAIIKMICNLGKELVSALWQAVKHCLTGNFSKIVPAFVRPWKQWWEDVKGIWKGFVADVVFADSRAQNTHIDEDPTDSAAEQAKNTNIEIRSLEMEGKNKGLDNLNTFAALANANKEKYGSVAAEDLLHQLQRMNKLYQINSEQTVEYSEFIAGVWEKGKGGDETSFQTMRILLESPELSQKLLSAFFYLDP